MEVRPIAKPVFASKIAVAVGVLGLLTLLLIVLLARIGRNDIAQYQALLQSSEAVNYQETLETFTGKQHRENVRKLVVFSEDGVRKQMNVQGKQSDLVLTYDGNKSEVIEHMQFVTCDMQEELFYTLSDGREAYRDPQGCLRLRRPAAGDPAWLDDTQALTPMQKVRHVDAETATYYYRQDLFAAESVTLLRTVTPTHAMPSFDGPSQPLMEGYAEAVRFSILGRHTALQAYHLKMKMYSGEGFL